MTSEHFTPPGWLPIKNNTTGKITARIYLVLLFCLMAITLLVWVMIKYGIETVKEYLSEMVPAAKTLWKRLTQPFIIKERSTKNNKRGDNSQS